VVRSIVELHGGSATVASVLGQGSTFTLVFPQAPGRHAPAPKTSAEPSATS
jgi:signal transduction histidine kinase